MCIIIAIIKMFKNSQLSQLLICHLLVELTRFDYYFPRYRILKLSYKVIQSELFRNDLCPYKCHKTLSAVLINSLFLGYNLPVVERTSYYSN